MIQSYRRWTKYSNPEDKSGMTPLSPNVNFKQRARDLSCWGVDFFVHPSQPLEEENNFEFCWALGGKVVRGLNILSSACISHT